ncbi:Lrp/AsnC family transcriptional regulator [Nonomuraea sp. NPDC050153]|uniref:Lrp/AsnC family transcriptional regulator n=1 Tax=Nonomuraea sp. NPDC050153 TaxID=3364359 RepID=UPI0037905A69
MLDDLDRSVIHALHIDGRAPFSGIGRVLGVSTQTVARRYQRLRANASLRVVGLPDPRRVGSSQWVVRLTTSPATTRTLAHALARRPDTSWIKLLSGGTEIFAMIHVPHGVDDPPSMLLHDLPRKAGITAVSAQYLLHPYRGGPTAWRGIAQTLDDRQRQQLAPAHATPPGRLSPDRADQDLLDALRHDGRASYADLARATGWSEATVARRLTDLRAHGTIFFDVEIDPVLLGVATQAVLWMAIAPAHLDHVATALAGHDELAAVAHTTGPTNLLAHALCSGTDHLHRYITHRLGALAEIRTIETAPVLQTLKHAGPFRPGP